MGILNSSRAFQNVDYRETLRAWLANTPEEWGFRDENLVGRIGSAALPMGFNRKPHYARGLLLVGDSGGMVNPFNGEGIDYALESGHLAADVIVQALSRPEGPARERALEGYAAALEGAYGGYFTLGQVVREGDRQSHGDEAGHQVRAPASRADAVHAQADGEPHRPEGRRRLGPDHQCSESPGPHGLIDLHTTD